MSIKNGHTCRGFEISEFTDSYGVKGRLQKSSSAMDDYIWLGVSNAKTDAQIMTSNQGWQPYDIPDAVLLHDCLHLNREQVSQLIPYLQRFVEIGELYEYNEDGSIKDNE